MDELLQKYIDRQAFADDTQFGVDQLATLEAAFDRLKEIKVNLQGASGIKDIATSVSQAAPIIEGLTNTISAQTATIKANTDASKQQVTAQNDLNDSAKKLQTEKAKLAQLTTDEAKQIAEVKLQQQQQNITNKEAAINTLGLRDSYQLLNAEYIAAQKSAKALSAQAIIDPKFKGEADAAAQKAKGLSDVLKTIDASVGQFQRNVGNYTSAVSILQKGFSDAKAQLDGLSQSERNNTTAGQQLQKEVQILGTLSQQQTEGFRSLTSELRTSERALRTMYEAGLSGTSTFEKLQTEINNATREVRDFGRQQTLLQSESPAIAGLTVAARGLGGAYAVSAGAAALFADGNEKVSKELNKLVAIMTFLQGLTEFNRFLQEKEAIAKALNIAKTTFLAAAEELVAFATGKHTAALELNTAAQEKNTAIKTADAVVTDVAAGSDDIFAGAQEKVTDAIAAANTAIIAKNNALVKEANAMEQAGKAEGKITAATTLNTVATKKDIASTEADALAKAELATASTGAVAPIEKLAITQEAAAAGSAELAVSSEAATVGMGSQAAGAAALEAGLDGVAVSEIAVAEGASTMAAAILATGIGLLIVGLSVAVYKIVEQIKEWKAANASIKQANEDVTKSLKDLIDATKTFDDLNRESTTRQLEDMDKLIAKRKALGVSQGEVLALDKQAADARVKATGEEVKLNDISKESVDKKNADAVNAAGVVKATEELKAKYIQETASKAKLQQSELLKLAQGQEKLSLESVAKLSSVGDSDYAEKIKRFDDQIKKQKEESDLATASYKNDAEKFKASEDAKQQSALLSDQAIKLSADERRKYILETTKISADLETAQNDRILNSDRSTLNQRLQALKNNLAEQKRVIAAENVAIQNDPTASGTDKQLAAARANADTQKAIKDEQDKEYHLKEDARVKEISLVTQTEKDVLDVIVKTNQDIYNNDALTEQQRLEALKASIDTRKAILDNQFKADLSTAGISDPDIARIKKEGFFEIENKKITDEELKKLITEYNISEVQLTKDAATEKIKIVKDYLQQEVDENTKALKKLQLENDKITEDRADTYNNELIDLNKSYAKKLISLDDYNDKRKKIEANYAKGALQDQLEFVKKEIDSNQLLVNAQKKAQDELEALKKVDTSKLTLDEKKIHDDRIKQVTDELKTIQDAVGKETALYKELSKILKELSDADHTALLKKQQDVIDFLGKIKQVTDETFNAINGIINIGTVKQKNALQDQSDAIDRNSQKEIDAINASTLSEQDKAAKIIQANARVQAQKDQIAIKNREIDRKAAIAQKEEAIFNIILNTAIAIAKAAGNPFKIALAAASGAIQLAIAVATPIPHYKHGKNDGYEGPAVVGDGGVPEYIHREDGTIEKTPAKDTLTFVGKKDIIYPDMQSMMRALSMPSLNFTPVKDNGSDEIVSVLGRKMDKMTNAIINKKELSLRASAGGMEAIWKWGSRQTKYIDENTQW